MRNESGNTTLDTKPIKIMASSTPFQPVSKMKLSQSSNNVMEFDILSQSCPEMIEDFFNPAQQQPTLKKDKKVRVSKELKEKVAGALSAELAPEKIKSIQTPSEALTTHANNILKSHVTSTPQYKSIVEQIIECKHLIIKFTKVDPDNRLAYYKQKMEDLLDQRKQFDNILNSNNYYQIKRVEGEKSVNVKAIISRDNHLNAFKEKEKTLHSELQQSSPYYLVEKMRAYREQLNLREIHTQCIIEDFDDMFSDVIDTKLDYELTDQEISDERISDVMVKFTYPSEENNKVISSTNDSLIQNYNECCSYIGRIINEHIDEVADMPLGTIFSYLKKSLAKKDEALIEEYDYVRLMIMNRQSEIYADVNNEKFGISDLIFQNYKLNTPEGEKQAKELLASSSIKTVKGIAYKICSKYKTIEKYDDAVSYGLVGLTMAINKYIEMQKSKPDLCLNFKSMINTFVASTIKSGFVEMNSMGVASTSHIQRQHTILNKRVKNFIKFNPEYANANQDELREMLTDNDDFMSGVRITLESQYTSPDNESESSNEIWDIVCKSKENLSSFTESKSDHKLLLASIKKMLNLFEPMAENSFGAFSVGKKLFDKYDTRLFEMSFGFDYKRASGDTMTNGSANYTQAEMGSELERMYKMEGINKTFSQPAIATRIAQIYKKIKFAVATNTELKRAFEYINKVFYENHEYMELHSNEREASGKCLSDRRLQEVKLPVSDEDVLKLKSTQIILRGCVTNNEQITSEITEMFNEEMM